MSPVRLALLTEIPAPYRIPLFNALAARPDVEPEVIFLRARNPDRPYRLHEDELRFSRRVLAGVDVTVAGRWLVVNYGVGSALRAGQPEALVLGGWNQPAFWRAALWARRRRVPIVLWVESTLRDARPPGGRLPKRLIARIASGFLVPGSASEVYVRSIAPAAPIVVAPNAVDAALFASRLAERETLRARFALRRPAVLYVGRLAHEKGVDVLLDATRDLDVDVVLAGSGRDEAALRARAEPNVRFLGQVDRDDLPAWYAAADVLCLPSRSEPWGMPLNEGAAAGLPLVATEAAGAAWHLIEDGVNGFRVPTADPRALRQALQRLVEDERLRSAAGARSRELAARMTPEAWAAAVSELVTGAASGATRAPEPLRA